MKKFSTLLIAAAFILGAGMSFAATNSSADFVKNYQAKRDAAIKKQDAKINEAQKRNEANKKALKNKQDAAKKQHEANKKAAQQRQQQRKDAVKNLKDSFKY